MAPVFVDTSIWYAAADDGDADCQVARSLLSEHAGSLVTSDLVLAELWNLVNARINHHTANQVVAAIAAGIARVECATDTDLEAAAAALADFGDQAFSLTDRTSWALMETYGDHGSARPRRRLPDLSLRAPAPPSVRGSPIDEEAARSTLPVRSAGR